ncbi:Unknown protein [Striga hermonthica]|uniref:TF-B3 domain-containing protein n=1 Tax=Striga hermonthica TaxID=68872 RepID=A0A9N7MM20_STRHE|nr:Unknown protein [Striga hermonthica]
MFYTTLQRLPGGLTHQYMPLVPIQCTLTMREGRTHEVTIRGNDEGIFFIDGWLQFLHAKDIRTEYYLWFDRNSLTGFSVTVFDEDAIERPLRHRFTLEIKKTHIERARLVVE